MAQPCSSSERTTQPLDVRRSTQYRTLLYVRNRYPLLIGIQSRSVFLIWRCFGTQCHCVHASPYRRCSPSHASVLPTELRTSTMPHALRCTSGLRVFALWVGTVGHPKRVPLSLRKVVIAHTLMGIRILNHRSRRKVTPLDHGEKA